MAMSQEIMDAGYIHGHAITRTVLACGGARGTWNTEHGHDDAQQCHHAHWARTHIHHLHKVIVYYK